jgi:putative DNA primase/helicase
MTAAAMSGVDDLTLAHARVALGRSQGDAEAAVIFLVEYHELPRELAELAVAQATRFAVTDLGNAERLVHQHGRELRYMERWGTWLVWDGRRWQPDDTGEVQRRAKETARGILVEAALEPDDTRRQALAKWSSASESAARLRDMVRLAQSEAGIPIVPAQLDADPWRLNVANGIIDLRTGELRPHDPGELHAKLAPAALDPQANAPRWEGFLAEVLPDPAVRRFVQKFAGYSLTGSVAEQVLAFLHGEGANGKSVFLGALRAVLGDYSMEAAPELLVSKRERSAGDLSAVADLQGRRFVSTIELDDGQRLAEGLVKQLTGEGTLKSKRMRQDFFEFPNVSKLWLAANHKPTVRGTDHAIWRRIRLVPFEVTIPADRRDPHLLERLAEERDGILSWLVEGCLAWQHEGLAPPDAVSAATGDYREESHPLRDWLDECTESDPGARTAFSDLWVSYGEWSKRERIRMPLGRKRFADALSEAGYEKATGTNNVKTRRGLRLLGEGPHI